MRPTLVEGSRAEGLKRAREDNESVREEPGSGVRLALGPPFTSELLEEMSALAGAMGKAVLLKPCQDGDVVAMIVDVPRSWT